MGDRTTQALIDANAELIAANAALQRERDIYRAVLEGLEWRQLDRLVAERDAEWARENGRIGAERIKGFIADLAATKAELAERGEFICKKCGLRKDSEHAHTR